MTNQAVILVNIFRSEAGRQAELLALLRANTDTVISTLPGWRATRLIAAPDGSGIAIYSEWESAAAVAAMRADPRMQAYFPRIGALASIDSLLGEAVHDKTR